MGRAKKSVPAPAAARGPLLYRIFQPGKLMLLACAAGAAVLTPWLLRQLPDLSTRPEYRLPFTAIELSPPPGDVVPADLVAQIQRQRDFSATVSILDRSLAQKLAGAFRQHPWIDSVREVRLTYPPRIVVEVTYRRPVGLVQSKSGLYPIDAEGVLLPPSDFKTEDVTRYPQIRNVRSVPGGAAGTAWGDPVVFAAARLADVLERDWAGLQLEAIVAPKPAQAGVNPADLMFELTAQGGSKIVWGRAPGSGHPGELTATQKIARLRKYLEEFGGFAQPRGPYEIDIRHWQEITRRPLNPKQIGAVYEERIHLR